MQKKSQKKLFDKVKFLKSQKNLAKIKIQTIYQKKLKNLGELINKMLKKKKSELIKN